MMVCHHRVFYLSDFKEIDHMAKRAAVAKAIEEITDALPHLIRLPASRAWIDYDEEADVLYVSLKRPQKATDTDFLEKQGILLRYRNKDLVGVTILDASKRKKAVEEKVTACDRIKRFERLEHLERTWKNPSALSRPTAVSKGWNSWNR